MHKKYFIILILLILSSISFASGIPDEDLPWSQEITEVAKNAMFLSIENLTKPIEKCDPHFPEGRSSSNFYFPYKNSEDFKVIGYSFSEANTVYTIEFHGIEFTGFGPRISVEIDITSGKIYRVYIKADA